VLRTISETVPNIKEISMPHTLKAGDLARLKKAHPDLKKGVIEAAKITTIPFVVLQADRTLAEQKANVKKGVSQTLDSRHLIDKAGFVFAVDIAPLGPDGKVSWSWPLYHKLAPIMKKAFANVGVPIEWGGDWRTFKDGPHWQLPKKLYPASK
jgi:peptidoglycan L-alanyl-D-glutamate endopeptidase CwlK